MSDGIKVLVVDDHPVFRDGLRQLLASTGEFVVVEEASDGQEALAYVGRHQVDPRMARASKRHFSRART